jgi:hypothetical protein
MAKNIGSRGTDMAKMNTEGKEEHSDIPTVYSTDKGTNMDKIQCNLGLSNPNLIRDGIKAGLLKYYDNNKPYSTHTLYVGVRLRDVFSKAIKNYSVSH